MLSLLSSRWDRGERAVTRVLCVAVRCLCRRSTAPSQRHTEGRNPRRMGPAFYMELTCSV